MNWDKNLDYERLTYKLDFICIKLNTYITSIESLLILIVPDIIRELETYGCEFHSMRFNSETREVRVCFSFNNNKTCICIVIETRRVYDDIVELKSYYYIQGDSCDFNF
jgi:hypothetical protein